jgi:hypothetical protein
MRGGFRLLLKNRLGRNEHGITTYRPFAFASVGVWRSIVEIVVPELCTWCVRTGQRKIIYLASASVLVNKASKNLCRTPYDPRCVGPCGIDNFRWTYRDRPVLFELSDNLGLPCCGGLQNLSTVHWRRVCCPSSFEACGVQRL